LNLYQGTPDNKGERVVLINSAANKLNPIYTVGPNLIAAESEERSITDDFSITADVEPNTTYVLTFYVKSDSEALFFQPRYGDGKNINNGFNVAADPGKWTMFTMNLMTGQQESFILWFKNNDGDGVYIKDVSLAERLQTEKFYGAITGPPEEAGKTRGSITVKAIDAPSNGQTVEYAVSALNELTPHALEALAWQPETTFEGLSADATYYVYARSASDDRYFAGMATASEGITTLK